ncbi:MAG TPA: hypothetical protein VHK88_01315 [Aquihabitans sp.]|nr:hypothetical protein [Aquihabitans sp.]
MHRLADLDRRGRVIAALAALLLVAPFATAAVRAAADGWQPSGASAVVALQALDVASGDPPLVGLPTDPDLRADPRPRHLGPLPAYALALPVALLGPPLGLVAWTAAVGAASVLVGAWALLRRGGPGVGAWGAVGLGALAWSLGRVALVDPVGAEAALLPLAATAIVAWAVASGDRRLLPLLALLVAWVAQHHLAVTPFALVLGALALGGLALPARAGDRRAGPAGPVAPVEAPPVAAAHDPWRPVTTLRYGVRSTAPTDANDVADGSVDPGSGGPAPAGGRARRSRRTGPDAWWPWLAGAMLVSAACWFPVAYGEATGQSSNAADVVRLPAALDGEALGVDGAARLAVRAVGAPPLVGLEGVTAADLLEPVQAQEVVGAAVVGALLLAIGFGARRRCPALGRLAVAALATAAAGLVVGATLPASAAGRLALHRWAWVASVLAWLALGWAAGRWVAAGRGRYGVGPRWQTPWVAVAALAVLALATSTVATDERHRDEDLFSLERRINARVGAAVAGDGSVLVLPVGDLARRSLAPALAAHLEADGHPVAVANDQGEAYGEHRTLARRRPDTAIIVRTTAGRVPGREGGAELVLEEDLDPDRRAAMDSLSDQARSGPVTVAPGAAALAAEAGIDPFYAKALLAQLVSAPARVLYEPVLVGLLADGFLASPALDTALLEQLRAHPPAPAWGDDRVEVLELSPGAALFLYPGLAGA